MKLNFLTKASIFGVLILVMTSFGVNKEVNPSIEKVSINKKIQTILSIKRLYNASSGKHYYTTATSGSIYSLFPINEGVLGTCLSTYDQFVYNKPIYALTKSNGDRILTISDSEKNYLTTVGFVYEGIIGYTASSFSAPNLYYTIYRYYNSSKREHFYTNNYNELGAGSFGYQYEGVAFQLSVN